MADALVASAAAAHTAAATADDEAPAVDDAAAAKMESGAHAGLQTASQVAAQLARAQAAESQRLQDMVGAGAGPDAGTAGGGGGGGGETIYRDASGRIVSVAMQRAEARRAAAEKERAAKEAAEAARGDVQRAERARRAQDLQDARLLTVARHADDEDMNEELRARDRWNDPAAGFLTARGKGGKSVTGRPLYKGSAAPNRYGIRPGHRWDGVDRGNGFEGRWFKARNKEKSRRDLEYAWQMDE